jgi:RHS repeat-associated protein
VSASVAGQVVTINQKALKGVTFGSSVSGTPTETLTLGTNVNGNITATVGGTITPGDVLSIVVSDIRFNNGPVTNSYKVKTGDTTTTIAAGLSSAIYANLGTVGTSLYPNFVYYPTYAGNVVTINPYQNYANVIYSKSVTGVPTETVTYSANFNGNTTATIGGTVTAGDVTSLTVYSAGLAGGSKTVSYTAAGGNTLTSIATGLRNAINADTNLAAIGVTATSSAAVVTIATAGTTYTTSTSGGATVTLTQGTNANGNSTVAVGGRVTAGNTATITTFNPTLPGGQQAVTFNIGASDTLVSIAAGLANAMNGNANLQTLGVTAKNSDAADLTFSQRFSGNGTVPSNASLANVSATDAVPTTKTNTNALTVTASASSTLTWDANGNMTSDGTNTYKWDAENRLIQIDYPGINNFTQFSYDGSDRNRRIVETVSGSVTDTKQFVYCGNIKCESRDAMGSNLRKYFGSGEKVASSDYFYSFDHMGSVREFCDSTGTVQSRYLYDSYGRTTVAVGNVLSDFQYAKYFVHSRSALYLTFSRAYNTSQTRWLSRDPIGEHAGFNLYRYVENKPVLLTDPTGLLPPAGTTLTNPGQSTYSPPGTSGPNGGSPFDISSFTGLGGLLGGPLGPIIVLGTGLVIVIGTHETMVNPNPMGEQTFGPPKNFYQCVMLADNNFSDCIQHPWKFCHMFHKHPEDPNMTVTELCLELLGDWISQCETMFGGRPGM